MERFLPPVRDPDRTVRVRDIRPFFIASGSGGSWTTGPDFPNGDNAGDSFAALLPSGNVLVFGVSGELYEFNGTSFTAEGQGSGVPLLVPTGQVLMFGYSSVSLYSPAGQPQSSWLPKIKTAPKTVTRGQTYKISGTQFNGLSQAMSFGDEFQNATNYPLVRITNNATGPRLLRTDARPQLDGRGDRLLSGFDELRRSVEREHRREQASSRGERHCLGRRRRHREIAGGLNAASRLAFARVRGCGSDRRMQRWQRFAVAAGRLDPNFGN